MEDPDITPDQFWKAIKIWLKNSHVVNRRLTGTVPIFLCKIYTTLNTRSILFKCQSLEFDVLKKTSQNEILSAICPEALENFKFLSDEQLADELCFSGHDDDHKKSLYLCLQKILPRSSKYKETFRFSLLDTHTHEACFVSLSQGIGLINLCPDFPYYLKLQSDKIHLEVSPVDPTDPSARWLQNELIPRLTKWALSQAVNNNGITEGSVNLISLDKYNKKYQELKEKYGQEMVKIWPENTDPAKFVFEDVAIASYLLLLWEDERLTSGIQEKQSFIDLGCGNGLLVYILASEGHRGRGVDVRKRGIWDLYPSFVKLEVDPVTPSKKFLYSDTDWLIGNHSDELTPWIPVIAARSSYNCRFFLLPCCAFEFDGKKYQRKDSSKSQYNEYLEYVKLICSTCGIKTDIDRLKIPSTKRICLIGTSRLYPRDLHEKQSLDIQLFIDKMCSGSISTSQDLNTDLQDKQWVSNFKPREGIEKVRNCTKIDKSIINEIIETVTTTLLQEKNYTNNKKWNSGGCLPIGQIVKLISPQRLKDIKSECGGLQTLLKNNHHIFEVFSGSVKFRHPRTKSEVLKHFAQVQKDKKSQKKHNSISKHRACWFYSNHPDGCPLTSEHCSYLHIK